MLEILGVGAVALLAATGRRRHRLRGRCGVFAGAGGRLRTLRRCRRTHHRSARRQRQPSGLNWADVDTDVLARFALGVIPLALAGGMLFAATPSDVLVRLLGMFLLGAVAWRHCRRDRSARRRSHNSAGRNVRPSFSHAPQRRTDHGAVLLGLRPAQGRLHRNRSGVHGGDAHDQLVAYGGAGVQAPAQHS